MVPDTIQGVLEARLDVCRTGRAFLQIASVIGKTCRRAPAGRGRSVEASLRDSLSRLQATEFIHLKGVAG
jgi:hypothetical protein